MSKVFIVGGSLQYANMFKSKGWEIAHSIEEANLIQFTGGSDVLPSYYGELIHPETYPNPIRDAEELAIFNVCKGLGKRMAGICRGGQFLHVMNGCNLWQHVHGHAIYGTHDALDVETGNTLQVTSTHHQMMREGDTGLTVLVGNHDTNPLKQHMIASGDVEAMTCNVDLEAVWHEDSKCFCFQPHPEFEEGQCREYYFLKLKEFFGLE